MKSVVKVLISKKKIAKRVNELGKSISSYYKNINNNILFIGILKGAFIFIADLCRAVTISHEIDFIIISSYGNKKNSSNSKIKIIKDLDIDVKNKNILIVEDIIDSGKTLNFLINILLLRNPKSIATCSLLNKPFKRVVDVNIEWIGFNIPNDFVVGYGIDYAQKYRFLPFIGKI
ncbi:MAG: hypoxanthine phosphoribosyltransferase [Enterobacteriaceae bacterium]